MIFPGIYAESTALFLSECHLVTAVRPAVRLRSPVCDITVVVGRRRRTDGTSVDRRGRSRISPARGGNLSETRSRPHPDRMNQVQRACPPWRVLSPARNERRGDRRIGGARKLSRPDRSSPTLLDPRIVRPGPVPPGAPSRPVSTPFYDRSSGPARALPIL